MVKIIQGLKRFKVFFIIGILILLIASILFSFHSSAQKMNGIAYLKSQKAKDITELSNQLEERRFHEVQEKLDSGELKYSDVFTDYVFLGDSRMRGFSSYCGIPLDNNLAKIGVNVTSIDQDLPTIQERHPKNVYLSFGINDIESNLGLADDGLHYDQLFESYVQKVLDIVPDANIYVNSIIPIQGDGPIAEKIPEYNDQLRALCERRGWIYIDNSDLISDPSMYENDGIYFVPSTYELWAEKMYLAGQNQK